MPFWSEYSQRLAEQEIGNEFFLQFEERARREIETCNVEDAMTGGLQFAITEYDLLLALKNERIRFNKFASNCRQSPSEVVSFIGSLGLTNLSRACNALDVKLE